VAGYIRKKGREKKKNKETENGKQRKRSAQVAANSNVNQQTFGASFM